MEDKSVDSHIMEVCKAALVQVALDAAKAVASKAKEVANKVIEKEKDIGWKIGEKIP